MKKARGSVSTFGNNSYVDTLTRFYEKKIERLSYNSWDITNFIKTKFENPRRLNHLRVLKLGRNNLMYYRLGLLFILNNSGDGFLILGGRPPSQNSQSSFIYKLQTLQKVMVISFIPAQGIQVHNI